MRIVSLVVVASIVVACSAHTDDLTNGDAGKAYVAPSVCNAQQRCVDPGVFALAYPNGGIDECKAKALAAIKNPGDLSNCTDAQWKTCAADFAKAPCPSDPKAGGVPDQPASCKGC